MIDFIKPDHIHICVPPKKLEDAKQFDSKVIGLEEIERPKELDSRKGYWFAIAYIEFHIGVEAKGTETRRHTAFEVADVAAARHHLEKNGVKIVEEQKISGRERFAFIDPFGNKMELLQMMDK